MASRETNGETAPGRFEDIVAEYVQACDEGQAPDREQMIAAHADLADDLRSFFRLRDRTEELLQPLRSAAARVLNIRCPHCRTSIELVDDSDIHSICCSSCGREFSLVGSPETSLPSGLDRIGHFQFVEAVGAGQFGTVWKAHDLSLERTVAIKIPRSRPLQAAEAEVLLRDARVAAQLKHPHIVSVHEVGKHDDILYIVSDFIEGASLKEWLETNRPTAEASARLCATVSEALHYAHQRGVVHRDLKPGNIIIDSAGEPHVVDFGLAKREAGELTMTIEGQILGTPAYMSPEQARGEGHDADRRADVYSLGVILYELLTGKPPFHGGYQTLIKQILNDDPLPPRRLDDMAPRDLETICLKCLRKDPRGRYATAELLAADLHRYLDGQPILARPVGQLTRGWLWCRRRPAIGAFLILVTAAIVGAALTSREVQQRERADGLVNQLLTANVVDAPRIIEQLAPYGRRIRARLEAESQRADLNRDPQKLLLVNLALNAIAGEASRFDYLYGRMLAASHAEFPILCHALSDRRQELMAPLWSLAVDPGTSSDVRFRACCALAAYDRHDDRWERLGPFVAEQLVSMPLFQLRLWKDRLLPAAEHLQEPLERIHQNEAEPDQKRACAVECLASYLADQPEQLFRLLMASGEQQAAAFYRALTAHQTKAVQLLEDELNKQLPDSPNREQLERAGRRRAFAAIAAYRSGVPEMAAPVLRHNPDPRARTRFIHWAAVFDVDPDVILSQLSREQDATIRQALVLALGEFNPPQLSKTKRAKLLPDLMDIHANDPDAGVHGAVDWLLRKWGHNERIAHASTPLSKQQQQPEDQLRLAPGQWYDNALGHTMVVVEAGEFVMGAEFDRIVAAHDPQRRVNVGRTFAIASKEVSRSQMQRFLDHQQRSGPRYQPNKYSPAADSPQNMVTWYDAVAYCNWLSQQEGIPQDQWCYVPNADGEYGDGMQIAPNFLARFGYRLPTEAEWEYACRADTTTLRYFDAGEAFLPQYACFAQYQTQPVGAHKPNDFGLFDMLGNLAEWCHGEFQQQPGQPLFVDLHAGQTITNRARRFVRGGSFHALSDRIDSADRSSLYAPSVRREGSGFRVARTIVPAPQDLAQVQWTQAHALGRQGKWREAARLMQNEISHLSVDMRKWQELHHVQLFLGEFDRARAICDEMLRRFGDTANPNTAHVLAQVCLALPDCKVDQQIQRLAELSVTADNAAHFRDMGMLHYRQGEFAESEQWLGKALKTTYLYRPATLYYLAMVRHKRGNEADAQETFRQAERDREKRASRISAGGLDRMQFSSLIIESVRREAESLLSGE